MIVALWFHTPSLSRGTYINSMMILSKSTLNTLSIRKKLTLIILGICVSTLLSTSAIQLVFSFYNERALLADRLAVTAGVIAVQSTAALVFFDQVAARENLASLRIQPSIHRACIYNEVGTVFASYTTPDIASPNESDAHCPVFNSVQTSFTWRSLNLSWNVTSENTKIGILYLEYDLSSMYQNMANVWLFNLMIIMIAIIVAYIVSLSLQRLISRPILQLIETTRQFAVNHDYSIRAVKYSNDELGILTDDFNTMMEELKQHETELEKAIKELTQSNLDLERFAYICSHDLQEPLRMVSNYTQLLSSRYAEKLDNESAEYMEFITDGVARMRELINDILTYSRVSHNIEPPTAVNLEEVVSHVLDNLVLTIKERGANIAVDPLPTVLGHKSLLLQLFQNLISNAIKFCKDKPPIITIRTKLKGKFWEFAIQDNGIGIDPRYHNQVFEIFKRLNRREEYKGTGIGLAICKKVVETHGGRIWIKSNLGEGATFYFTLPDYHRKLNKGARS